MTMTTHDATISNPGSAAFSAIGRSFGAVVDGLRAQWRARRARAELEALDPRMLRDIGIDFSDVLVLTTHGTDAIYATRQRVIHRLDR
jgi:uncharacterized protein YjiS (DUF1127 family)